MYFRHSHYKIFINLLYVLPFVTYSANTTYQMQSTGDSSSGTINFDDSLTSAQLSSGSHLQFTANGSSFSTSITLAQLQGSDTLSFSHTNLNPLNFTINLQNNQSRTLASNLSIASINENVTLNLGSGSSLQLNGQLSGAGILTASGAGTMNLAGSLSGFTGQLVVQSGVSLTDASASTLPAVIQIDSTSSFTTASNLTGAAIYDSGTLNFNPGSGVTQNITAILTGSGSISKSGSGTTNITQPVWYTGATMIHGGTLSFSNAIPSGPITDYGQMNINLSNGTAVSYSNTLTGTGNVAIQGSGHHNSATFLNTLTGWTGSFQIQNATLNLNEQSFSSNISLDSTSQLNAYLASNLTYSRNITGSGSINIQGASLLTLSGSASYSSINLGNTTATLNQNSFTGDISHEGPLTLNLSSNPYVYTHTLQGNGAFALAGTGVLQIQGGGFQNAGAIDIPTGTGLIIDDGFYAGNIRNNGSLTFQLLHSNIYENTMIGTGSVTLTGGGSLSLPSLQTYSGGTTVQNGTLITSSQSFQGNYALSGSSSNSVLQINLQDSPITYSQVISGTGSIIKTGQQSLTLSTPQTYTGSTTVYEGNLSLQCANALSNMTDLTITQPGTVAMNNYDLAIDALAGDGALALGSGHLSLGNNHGSGTYSGTISGTGPVTKNGTGVWTVSGAQTYTGLTQIAAGTLLVGRNAILPSTNDLTISSGAIFDLNGFQQTLSKVQGSGAIYLGSAGLLTVNNLISAPATYNGVISGNGSLIQSGTGSWTLGAASTYTGSTSVSHGTMNLGVTNTLPTTTQLSLNFNARVNLATGISQTVQQLTGSSSTLALNSSTFAVNGAAVSSYSGAITGTAQSLFHLQGSSQVSLSGDLSGMQGVFSIDTGNALTLNNTLHAGTFTLNGSLSLNPASNQSLTLSTQSITGSGSLTQNGPGTLIVNENLGYTGSTLLSQGTTTLNNVTLATSLLTNNAILNYNGNTTNTWTVPYPIAGNTTATININPFAGQTIVFSGNWNFQGRANFNGTTHFQSSTTILDQTQFNIPNNIVVSSDSTHNIIVRSSANLLSGVWSLNGSTIKTTDATLPATLTSPLNTSSSGLDIGNQGLIVNTDSADLSLFTNLTGTGGLTKTGPYRLLLAPGYSSGYTVNYAGTTTVSQGTLVLNDLFLPTTDISLASGANLVLNSASTKTFASNIIGQGNIEISSGNITLSGNNSYRGTTRVDSGATLNIDPLFDGGGVITTYGTINVTVPEGETYILQNTFAGQGTIYKYGNGNLVLGGDFSNLIGVFQIVEGSINFVSNPPTQSAIHGSYTITTQTNSSSVWTLYADDNPVTFGGTITGLANTRFRLASFKNEYLLTLGALNLNGVLDLQVLCDPDHPDAMIDGPAFKINQFHLSSDSGINFQFDQADTSNITKPMLTYDQISLPNQPDTVSYAIQPLNISDVFSNREYQLIQLSQPTTDDFDYLMSVANAIFIPAVFQANLSIDHDEIDDLATLKMTLTKVPAGTILSQNKTVTPTVQKTASQLQSIGKSSAQQAQNMTQVLELASSPADLLSKVNNFTPTGNKKEQSNMNTSQGSSVSQSSMSSFSSANMLKKLHGGYRANSIIASDAQKQIYKSPSQLAHLSRKVMNPVLTKYYHPDDEDTSQYQWASLLDGLELAGLSVSAEVNYVHQDTLDADINNPGSSFNIWGATLGASHVIDEKYIVGILGSYVAKRIELHPNQLNKTSLTHEKVHSISAFLAYQDPEQPYYSSFYLEAGRHQYHGERTWIHSIYQYEGNATSLNGSVNSIALNQHKGYDLTGNVELGYTYIVNQEIALQPFVGAGFVTLTEPAYSETSYNRDTGAQTLYGNYMPLNSITKQSRTIGVHAIQSMVMGDATYQMSSRMSYVTERVTGDQTTFKYAYLFDTSSIINVTEPNPRMGAFEMSLALNAAFANQWIVSATYTGHFGKYLKSHTAVFSAQYTFS